MSNFIRSVALNVEELIGSRSLTFSGEYISSINVHQLTGDFAVTKPTINTVYVYPQSPNNPSASLIGETKTITQFSGFGLLNYPLDARFDNPRNKLWIADAGNQRIIKVDITNYLVEFVVENIPLPHSVVSNPNNGGFFVKSYSALSTGKILVYSSSGVLQDYFSYPDAINSLDPSEVDCPLPSTMVFDHRRSRLWWTTKTRIYMSDFLNYQVNSFDLFALGFDTTRGIDVDMNSGNSFVVSGIIDKWFILQMFRDNNRLLSRAYLPEDSITTC